MSTNQVTLQGLSFSLPTIEWPSVQHSVTKTVSLIAYRLKQIGNDFTARGGAERLLVGICRVISAVHPGGQSAGKIITLIADSNRVLDCFKLFGNLPYFFTKQLPKRDRLIKVADQIFRKEQIVECQGKTRLQYHLEKGDIFKVISTVTSTTLMAIGAIKLLDSVKIIDLAKTIGSFAPELLTSVSTFGWMGFFAVKSVISIKYLIEAYQGDWTKDKTKGWLQLATSVSILAVQLLGFFGAPLLVLGIGGVIAGSLALSSCFYAGDRKAAKDSQIKKLEIEVVNVNSK